MGVKNKLNIPVDDSFSELLEMIGPLKSSSEELTDRMKQYDKEKYQYFCCQNYLPDNLQAIDVCNNDIYQMFSNLDYYVIDSFFDTDFQGTMMCKLINYLDSVGIYKYCYVLHKPENEDNKWHYHIMIKCPKYTTLGGFKKFFGPFIANGYAEGVSNPYSYLLYMIHRTPETISQNKIPYSPDDYRGNFEIVNLIVQKSHFVQLRDILKYARVGLTPFEALEYMADSDINVDEYIQYIENHSYAFGLFYNSEYNKFMSNLREKMEG